MAFYCQTYVKVSYSEETLEPKHAFPNLIFLELPILNCSMMELITKHRKLLIIVN